MKYLPFIFGVICSALLGAFLYISLVGPHSGEQQVAAAKTFVASETLTLNSKETIALKEYFELLSSRQSAAQETALVAILALAILSIYGVFREKQRNKSNLTVRNITSG